MKYQFLRVLLLALPYETRKKTLQMAGERLYWMAVKKSQAMTTMSANSGTVARTACVEGDPGISRGNRKYRLCLSGAILTNPWPPASGTTLYIMIVSESVPRRCSRTRSLLL